METGAKEYFPAQMTVTMIIQVTKLKNGNYALGIAFISGRARNPDFTNIAKLSENLVQSKSERQISKT